MTTAVTTTTAVGGAAVTGAGAAELDSAELDSAALDSAELDSAELDSADAIPTLREQIDALDEAIVRLVAERTRLSRRIQIARMNAGGTRVELGRERVIRDAYRAALGPQGPHLADAILQVGRGER